MCISGCIFPHPHLTPGARVQGTTEFHKKFLKMTRGTKSAHGMRLARAKYEPCSIPGILLSQSGHATEHPVLAGNVPAHGRGSEQDDL